LDNTFIQEQITATKALIVAHQTASLAAATAGIQIYKLDTGQSISTVNRFDVKDLNTVVDSLYNTLATLEARLTGASSISRPGF